MSWNYRVVRHHNSSTKETFLEIVFAYYYKSSKTPKYIAVEPTACGSESMSGLRADLTRMRAATREPVVQCSKFDPYKKCTMCNKKAR